MTTTTTITMIFFFASLLFIYGGFEIRKFLVRRKKIKYYNAICDSKIMGIGMFFMLIALGFCAYGIYTLELFHGFLSIGASEESSFALGCVIPAIIGIVSASLLEGFDFYELRYRRWCLIAFSLLSYVVFTFALVWGISNLNGDDNIYVLAVFVSLGFLMIEIFEIFSGYFKFD